MAIAIAYQNYRAGKQALPQPLEAAKSSQTNGTE